MEGFRNEGFVEVVVVEYLGGDLLVVFVLIEMVYVVNCFV